MQQTQKYWWYGKHFKTYACLYVTKTIRTYICTFPEFMYKFPTLACQIMEFLFLTIHTNGPVGLKKYKKNTLFHILKIIFYNKL